MYKSKLQEICQQRLWSLPTYSSNRDGPDHCPRFRASVVVNGVSFDSSDFCKSSKEAQNEAAKAAFQHFNHNAFSQSSPPSSIVSSSASNRETVVVKNEVSSNCTVYGSSSGVTDGRELADVNYMYKTKLQEICHQRLWSLPTYSSIKDGPDHYPRFRASVVVNGISFDSSDFCKSSKEAQNEAAKVAFHHFNLNASPNSSVPSSIASSSASSIETVVVKNEVSSNCMVYGSSSGVSDGREFADVNHVYKSQLQNYAQKKSLGFPVYSHVREGSPPALRFKATVNVDGRTFESPEFFRTLKEAEHAAAKAAFSSLSTNGIQEDDCSLYKNLLQELATKEGFSIPVYTTKSGSSQVPTFTSSVEVEGDIFHGIESKTKKQAEKNAAKVAYISLRERQMSRIPAQSFAFEFIYPNSPNSQPNIAADFQLKLNLEGQSSRKPPSSEAHDGIEIIYPDSSSSNSSIISDLEQKLKFKDKDEDVVDTSAQIITKTVEVKAEDHSTALRNASGSSSQDGSSSPTTVLECLDRAVTEQNANQKTETECTWLCNRVLVYPRKLDLNLPMGVTMLPISDDQWVAVSVDYSDSFESRSLIQ